MECIESMLRDIRNTVTETAREIGRSVLSEQVMDVMQKIPRDLFVPESQKKWAYRNGPLPIGYQQTISQPYIVALMSDLIQPNKNQCVLEVGTGCGYQTAILSELTAQVYSLEVIPELSLQARQHFDQLHISNIQCRVSDGYQGWPEYAPFDAIVVTAACQHIPQPLVEQLIVGGRMIIPLDTAFYHQELTVVHKISTQHIETFPTISVRFVPLTGKYAVQ